MKKIFMSEPNLKGNEKKYLINCIKSNFVSSHGVYLEKFENKIKQFTESKGAVLTSSGSAALNLALLSLGVKRDEIVIAPSFTFAATINAITLTGAKPWLFDVNLDDWNLNLDQLDKELKLKTKNDSSGKTVLKKNNKKISALIVVYSFGLLPNMKLLKKIANKYRIPIIADAACSLGAKMNDKSIGNVGADLSIISFNGNKTITTGGGGALISNNLRLLKKAKYFGSNARSNPDYTFNEVGFNYRMNNIQAALGLAQIEKINFYLKKKIFINTYYKKKLNKLDLKFFPEKKNFQSSCWFSGFIAKKNSNKVRNYLNKMDIESRKFWKPMHLQKPYLKCLKTSMVNTNYIWNKIVTLPSGTGLSKKSLDKISSTLLKYYE